MKPAHNPDDGLGILSPAERRVLEYVREGTLDAEIAVRLGVPVGDVKDRIASMRRKLNLSDRAALAAWTPSDGPHPPDRTELPPDVLADPEGAPPETLHRSLPNAGTLVSLVLVVLFAAGAIGFLLWSNETSEPRARADTTPADIPALGPGPQPSPAPGYSVLTPSPGSTVAAGQLKEGIPGALPPDVRLLLLRSCDGGIATCPPHSRYLELVASPASGEIARSVVFDPADRTLLDAVASHDGQVLFVMTCLGGGCLGAPGAAEYRLHRSIDGGANWQARALPDGPVTVVGVEGIDAVVTPAGGHEYGIYDFGTNSFRDYGGTAPARQGLAAPDPRFALSNDRRLILTTSGDIAFDPQLAIGSNIMSFVPGAAAGEFYVDWQGGSPSPMAQPTGFRLSWFQGERLMRIAEQPGPVHLIRAITPGVVLANVVLDQGVLAPVTIDLTAGFVYRIDLHEPAEKIQAVGVAAWTVPRTSVTGAGDCLNVRAAPNTGGGILGCFPDATVLEVGGVAFVDAEDESLRWYQVRTPAGETGYARSDFLSSAPDVRTHAAHLWSTPAE